MSQAAQGNQRVNAMTQAKEAQLKSYQKRLKDDIKAMTDNFLEMMRVVKVSIEGRMAGGSVCVIFLVVIVAVGLTCLFVLVNSIMVSLSGG